MAPNSDVTSAVQKLCGAFCVSRGKKKARALKCNLPPPLLLLCAAQQLPKKSFIVELLSNNKR